MAVKEELKKLGLHFIVVELGEVEIMEKITAEQRALLQEGLVNSGLELMEDRRSVLIERIKNAIIEMVHHSEEKIRINFFALPERKNSTTITLTSPIYSRKCKEPPSANSSSPIKSNG